MTEAEVDAKLAELDRLLNDPEVRLDPERVWTLLAELTPREAVVRPGTTPLRPPTAPGRVTPFRHRVPVPGASASRSSA